MSYGVAEALQAAIYQRLSTDAALIALAGTAIHDAPPPGTAPDLMVLIGPETVRERADITGPGAEHEFTVSVVGGSAGFATVKAAAVAVSDALEGAQLSMFRGRLVGLWFLRAEARRDRRGQGRRVDLVFRARVED
jgi:hypothetical protein